MFCCVVCLFKNVYIVFIILFRFQSSLYKDQLKGIVHPKMKILSLITPFMSFQTHKTFVHVQNTNYDVFNEIRSIAKLKLSHWCDMDCFYRCIYYVSGPGNISVVLLSMWGSESSSDFIKNTLICVLKMNEGPYGFGTIWGGSNLKTEFSFWVELSFKLNGNEKCPLCY